MFTIKLDTTLCSGHARCAAIAPDIYRLDDNGYCISNGDTVPDNQHAIALRGARACPERAISIVSSNL